MTGTILLFCVSVTLIAAAAYLVVQEVRDNVALRFWSWRPILGFGVGSAVFLFSGLYTLQPALDAHRAEAILAERGKFAFNGGGVYYHQIGQFSILSKKENRAALDAVFVPFSLDGKQNLLPVLAPTNSNFFWKYTNRGAWTPDLSAALKAEVAAIEALKVDEAINMAAEAKRQQEAQAAAIEAARRAWPTTLAAATRTN